MRAGRRLELDEHRPFSTAWPALDENSSDDAAASAFSSFSIFIASMMTTPWPAARLAGSTSTRTIRPGIGARTGFGPCARPTVPVMARMARVRSSTTLPCTGQPSTCRSHVPSSARCATTVARPPSASRCST
jgi:hypothetical protein